MTSKGQIRLEPFSHVHIEKTYVWISDVDLQKQFLIRTKPTPEAHRTYFKKVLSDTTQRVYAIIAGEKHVGNCGIKNISVSDNEGELWIYIGDPLMRRKSIGQHATQLVLMQGYETLGLSRIYLHVAEFNHAARRLYLKLGFIEVPLKGRSEEWNERGCTILRMEHRRGLS